MIVEVKIENPFVGLRPFDTNESLLFFGRDRQLIELLKRLHQHRFLAVVGGSGSGKSSLVRAGLIPKLQGGFLVSDRDTWLIAMMRPGENPLQSFALALSEVISGVDPDVLLESIKLRGVQAVLDSIAHELEEVGGNLLILVDQFEEIFRFSGKDNAKNAQSHEFVSILMTMSRLSGWPVYTVVTMRSDFIGECDMFPGLPETLNACQYLVPRLDRSQWKQVIVGPIRLFGKEITDRLLDRLLNDLSDKADQLPILQHVLMRMWERVESRNESVLGIKDYEAVGTVLNALSIHANEVYESLGSEEEKRIAEVMFRVLTERFQGDKGIRNPESILHIAEVATCDTSVLMRIVEKFRNKKRSFLMPPPEIPLIEDTVIDIAHESLMRNWDRLKVWVANEYASVQRYRKLTNDAALYQIGAANLMGELGVKLFLEWQQKEKPNAAWARRYDGNFELSMAYLAESHNALKKQQELEKQHRLHKKKSQRRRMVTISFLALVFAVMSGVSSVLFVKSKQKNEEIEKQKLIAIENAAIADKEKKKANFARSEAIVERKKAEKASNLAIEQASIAKTQAIIAKEEAFNSFQSQQYAYQQQQKADAERKKALMLKDTADMARLEANNLRLRSIAKFLSLKSLQVTDPVIKALLAQQAYLFNLENGENLLDTDIYNGLYYAVKALFERKQKEHNIPYNMMLGHEGNVRRLVKGPKNNIYSTGSDGKILFWDIDNLGSAPVEFVGHEPNQVNKAMAINASKSQIVAGGDYAYIQFFDFSKPSNEPKIIKKGGYSMITGLIFRTDHQLIVLDKGKRVVIHNIKGKVTPIYTSKVKINAIDFNANAETIVMAKSDGSVTKLDLKNNNNEYVLYKGKGLGKEKMLSVVFSKDGKLIAAGNEQGVVKVWESNSGRLIFNQFGHEARVNSVQFSSDNKRLASASFDGSVNVWEVSNLNGIPIKLDDHDDWVWFVEFSPDGEYLLAGCKNDVIKRWPMRPSTLSEGICAKVGRNLTKEEWIEFVGKDIPYRKTCPFD